MVSKRGSGPARGSGGGRQKGESGPRTVVPTRQTQPEWLDQKLRSLYEDVAQEPIPEEFLNILARLPPGPDKS